MVPFDKQTPMVTSGVRIGTPALTSRGMKEPEMVKIGNLICNVLGGLGNKSLYKSTLSEVKDLCREFPLYSS